MKLCGTETVYCSVVEMKLMVAMVKLCSLNDFVGCCRIHISPYFGCTRDGQYREQWIVTLDGAWQLSSKLSGG